MTIMKSKARFLALILGLIGCTTVELSPPLPPTPPAYTAVSHPLGNDVADLSNLFLDGKAPKFEEITQSCDGEFKKLNALTQSVLELSEGSLELVKQDPVAYHWCFYGKLLEVENTLNSAAFVDEKQKKVIETYQFLVPVAKAFSSQFHDTRYLRFAIYRYKRASELVFFRKLELTPAGTSELVQPENPFGLWRDGLGAGSFSVLEKYHLIKKPAQDTGLPSLLTAPSPSPLAAPSPPPSAGVSLPPLVDPLPLPSLVQPPQAERSVSPSPGPSGVSPGPSGN